jgi:hypothetical protein
MSVIRNLDRTLVEERWQVGDQYAASQEAVEEWLAVGLAMIAGFLDAYGIITYQTYVSFMSGNTTQVGDKIGQGNLRGAAHSAMAIVSLRGRLLRGSFACPFRGASDPPSGFLGDRRLAGVYHRFRAARLFVRRGSHCGDQFRDGRHEYCSVSGWRAVPGRRTIGEPDLCDRDVEQDRGAPRHGGQACGRPG